MQITVADYSSASIGNLPAALLDGGGGPLLACRSEVEVSSSEGGDKGRESGAESGEGV